MDTYAARLASFSTAHGAAKKRASEAKGSKKLKWPHKSPSPSQLAQAGLYYQPTASSLDNVTCYLCECNIDGWEATDVPVEEHRNLSPGCGWAVIAHVERSIELGHRDLEDPNSEPMVEARRSTFGTKWPHENKRGWVCKTERMVEAGWHYCPTPESDDLARCSYCSLSLDGWEPKDNPLEEHQRRSPDCYTFRFSPANAPPARTKKGRMSKASRLSTQSAATEMPEAPSTLNSETGADDSILSTGTTSGTTKARTTKKGTKGQQPKNKHSLAAFDAMQANSSYMEPEDDDFSVKVPITPKANSKSKKRKSDQLNGDKDKNEKAANVASSNPPKRRATRSRQSHALSVAAVPEPEIQDDEQISKSKPSKKGRPSNAKRKASTVGPKAKAAEPNRADEDYKEIEAALEMELDEPMDDEDEMLSNAKPQKGRRLTRSRTGTRQASSAAPVCRTRMSAMPRDDPPPEVRNKTEDDTRAETKDLAEHDFSDPSDEADESDFISAPKATKKPTKRKAGTTKKATKAREEAVEPLQDDSITGHKSKDVPEPVADIPKKTKGRSARGAAGKKAAATAPAVAEPPVADEAANSSIVDKNTADDSGNELEEATVASKPFKGAAKKKPVGRKGKKTTKAQEAEQDDVEKEPSIQPSDKETQTALDDVNVASDIDELHVEEQKPMVVRKASKTTRAPKASKSKKTAAKKEDGERVIKDKTQGPLPEARHVREDTPHQPSDAENQPPSSQAFEARPPLEPLSPAQPRKIALGLRTPTQSPSKMNIAGLRSTLPWTAVDLDQIFHASPAVDGQENDPFKFVFGRLDGKLDSPEKRMSVEQWIHANAQKGEEKLRVECERIVGNFESEGVRALKVLEGIVCT